MKSVDDLPRQTAPDLARGAPVLQELQALARARRRRVLLVFAVLTISLAACMMLAIGFGAVLIQPHRILEILWAALRGQGAGQGRDALVILEIRLPRALLGLMIGAVLAASGALMQSLFRNPLADPGLIGVSAGAGLAAAVTIVLGDTLFGAAHVPFALLPMTAFIGSLSFTVLLYAIATRNDRTSVAILLLAGIALAAIANAATGFLIYVADDRQLRDLTFWSLGSLGGASWEKVAGLAPIFVIVLIALPLLGRSLNALAIGEAEAFYSGVSVQRVKVSIIVVVALATGASVAVAGIIAFVGIIVPHFLRISLGADHALLLPASLLLGGILLLAADTAARIVVAPAELPIGILTAAIGAPFFLWLLLRRRAGSGI